MGPPDVKTLFFRIFLSFWAAMVVVAVGLVVTSPFFTRSRPGVERWQEEGEGWARRSLDGAAHLLAEEGPAALHERRRLRHSRRQGPARLYVFDSDGRDARDQDPPESARLLARRASARAAEQSERRGGRYLVARPLVDRDGRELVIVASLDRPPRPVDLLEPGALWVRLGGLALVVGFVSLALARYLSRPVAALRSATRRLAVGDLSARVGPPVARRSDEIGALARDFDAMADRVEALVGSQRRLLRDVSHELRSPLARLRVALELARRPTRHPADEALDRIEREAGRLDELIGRILLLEKLQAGSLQKPGEQWDLADLVREVCDDASFESKPKECEIVLEAPRSVPFAGSAELVRSGLDNIVRNAVRHAPAGTAVDVRLRAAGATVTIVVRDRGEGVADDQLEALFQPFARVGESRDRESGGSGLGLAIARRAIELHGGEVRARNYEDGGLEVTVDLPALVPDP